MHAAVKQKDGIKTNRSKGRVGPWRSGSDRGKVHARQFQVRCRLAVHSVGRSHLSQGFLVLNGVSGAGDTHRRLPQLSITSLT